MKRISWVLWVAAFGLLVAACESGGGGEPITPDPDEGTTTRLTIVATEGGVVATPSGKASVQIPAGALAADTEISIEVLAKDSATEANVYDFGPDGTQFAQDVTISLDFEGSAGAEQKAVLAYFDEDAGEWVEIPGSGLANGKVSGAVNHFTRFSIIFVEDQAILVSDCAEIFTGWQACGGDPVGSWTLKDICFENTPVGELPGISEVCPDARIDVEFTWDGSVDIQSGGTVVLDLRSQTMTATYVIPVSCLAHEQIQLADCAALAEQLTNDEDVVTCNESAGNCECAGPSEVNEMGDGPQTGTWAVEGNGLIMSDLGDDGPEDPVPFCVQGDLMTVQTNMGDMPTVMVWEK